MHFIILEFLRIQFADGLHGIQCEAVTNPGQTYLLQSKKELGLHRSG